MNTPMNTQLIVVGTDTGCGKTIVTGLIAHYFIQSKRSVSTQKWVQTGSRSNDDLAIHNAYAPSLLSFPTNVRCPYSFPDPVSPHWASQLMKKTISLDRIKTTFYAIAKQVELLVCETSGGIMVPYTDSETQLDLLVQLNVPIVVVAANRLGVLNHTLLTVNRLLDLKLTVYGVILSQCDETIGHELLTNNEKTLQQWLPIPVLGTVPYLSSIPLQHAAFTSIGDQLHCRHRGVS
jgi:dethiobiotin synthase